MTPTSLRLIGSSFEAVARDPDGFAAAFRSRAGVLDPSLGAALRRADGGRALGMIEAVAQTALARSGKGTTPAGEALRHRWAFIQPRHYGTAGQALLDAMRICLGTGFGDDVRSAWADAFMMLADDLMARRYNPLGLVA